MNRIRCLYNLQFKLTTTLSQAASASSRLLVGREYTHLLPENWLSSNLLRSLPKAIDWSCRCTSNRRKESYCFCTQAVHLSSCSLHSTQILSTHTHTYTDTTHAHTHTHNTCCIAHIHTHTHAHAYFLLSTLCHPALSLTLILLSLLYSATYLSNILPSLATIDPLNSSLT